MGFRFKGVRTGVIVAVSLGLLGIALAARTAVAEPVARTIEAYFGVKIVAGGRSIITDKEAFIYNGSTYVPLRVVSEALGREVSWDGANYQVIIADELVKSVTHLGSLPPTDWDWSSGKANQKVKLGGTDMSPALWVQSTRYKPAHLSWALNGQHKTLEGIIGHPDRSRDEGEATITFTVDGKPVATINLLEGTEPQSFKIDVANALELRVDLTCGGTCAHALVGTLNQ